MSKPQKFKDPNGKHVRVYATLLNSPAYIVLGYAAKALFIDLRNQLTSTNNGDISATLSDLKHRGWSSSATLAKALSELRTMGFIAVTRMGGLKLGTRICTLYRFTDLEVYQQPKTGVQAVKATHDYALIKSLREAEQVMKAGFETSQDADVAKPIQKKNPPVQKLKRNASETEAIDRFIASVSEQGGGLSLQKMNREFSAKNS